MTPEERLVFCQRVLLVQAALYRSISEASHMTMIHGWDDGLKHLESLLAAAHGQATFMKRTESKNPN